MKTALLVRQKLGDLARTRRQLERAGYDVISTTEFQEAKSELREHPPELLVSDVRLGPFNGLQLIILKHLRGDSHPSILLDEQRDIVLERDAARYGAAYLGDTDPRLLDATLGAMTYPRLAAGSVFKPRNGNAMSHMPKLSV